MWLQDLCFSIISFMFATLGHLHPSSLFWRVVVLEPALQGLDLAGLQVTTTTIATLFPSRVARLLARTPPVRGYPTPLWLSNAKAFLRRARILDHHRRSLLVRHWRRNDVLHYLLWIVCLPRKKDEVMLLELQAYKEIHKFKKLSWNEFNLHLLWIWEGVQY